MKISPIILLFLTIILLAGLSCTIAAGATAIPVTVKADNTYIAPFSSAYYNWLNTRSAATYKSQEGHGLGLIPAPVDLSGTTETGSWGSSVNNPSVVGYTLQRTRKARNLPY